MEDYYKPQQYPLKPPIENDTVTLRKKCPYSELFWSAFSSSRTEYGKVRSISPYSVRMQENADQHYSEYGHFSPSVSFREPKSIISMKTLFSGTFS